MEDWKNVRFCTETPWRAGKEGASGEGGTRRNRTSGKGVNSGLQELHHSTRTSRAYRYRSVGTESFHSLVN